MFSNLQKSHMPFIAYGKSPEFIPKAICCLWVNNKWKLHHFENGEWKRINTGLPEDATECSPTAEYIDGKWKISFIAGGFEPDKKFYLYRIADLENPISEKVLQADVGFIWKNKIISAKRNSEIFINDSKQSISLRIPNVQWLYRISYNPDNPQEFLISGQLNTGKLFSWICNPTAKYLQEICNNDEVAYKLAISHGRCFYAKRGNGFEDRTIVEAENLQKRDLDFEENIAITLKVQSPSNLKMLQNFTSATFRWAKSGFRIADDETLEKRKAICDSCKYWSPTSRMGMGKCLKCGCSSLKLKFKTEKCPIGKW